MQRFLFSALLLVVTTACGSSGGSPSARATATPLPTPTLAQQIRRAERAGPGFLDYCPLRNGQGRAKYQVDVPGNPVVPGWCRTSAARRPAADVITFVASWDARKVIGKTGSMSFTYRVGRRVSRQSTPIPYLVRQSGTLPP